MTKGGIGDLRSLCRIKSPPGHSDILFFLNLDEFCFLLVQISELLLLSCSITCIKNVFYSDCMQSMVINPFHAEFFKRNFHLSIWITLLDSDRGTVSLKKVYWLADIVEPE